MDQADRREEDRLGPIGAVAKHWAPLFIQRKPTCPQKTEITLPDAEGVSADDWQSDASHQHTAASARPLARLSQGGPAFCAGAVCEGVVNASVIR